MQRSPDGRLPPPARNNRAGQSRQGVNTFMGISNWGLSRARKRARTGLAAATLSAVAIVAAGTVFATPAMAATGSSTHWTWLGATPANGSVSLAFPLTANLSGLQQFATAVSDPKSPQYGQFESIANLARRFGAPTAQRARVTSYLRRAGATGG